jgi:hypothetical protein
MEFIRTYKILIWRSFNYNLKNNKFKNKKIMAIKIEENASPQAAVLAQLIKDMGIDTLSEDRQNELILKMTEVLLKKIFLETMKELDDQSRDEYAKMLEEEVAPEKSEAFLKEKIQNYDKMIQGVVDEFKNEMMTNNIQEPANINQ